MKFLHFICILGLLWGWISCRKTTDKSAIAWETENDAELLDLLFIDEEDFIAVGGIHFESGAILDYDAYSEEMTNRADGLPIKLLYDIDRYEDKIYACGQDGKVIHSLDSGQTWNVFENQTWTEFVELQYVHPDTGWAVGPAPEGGNLVQINDYGEYYRFHHFHEKLYSLYADGSKHIVVGGHGIIVYSRDGGQSFSASNAEGDIFIKILAVRDRLFAFGLWGSVLQSRDLGEHWSRLQPAKHRGNAAVVRDAVALPDGRMLRVGDEGLIHYSRDGWSSYEKIKIGYEQHNFLGIKLKNPNTVWVLGNNGLILRNIEMD